MSLTSAAADALPISIYKILQGEHREVSAILNTLRATPTALDGVRESAITKLRNEILSHSEAEEMTVYRALKDRSDKGRLIEDSEADHQAIESALVGLENSLANDEAFDLALTSLQDTFDAHVKKEEDQLFSEMRKAFSEDEARKLADDFLDEKKRVLAEFE